MKRWHRLCLPFLFSLAALVGAASADPAKTVATVPQGPQPWWSRALALTPHGDAVGSLTLVRINATLKARGVVTDETPVCAIQPLDWATMTSDDAVTRRAIGDAATDYPGAFAAPMVTRPGHAVFARVVAMRRCGASEVPALAILTTTAAGGLDDLATVPWPFVRLQPIASGKVSIFACLDCASPVANVAPRDWLRHARWRPLTPAKVTTPPVWLGADPFYARYVAVDDMAILASAKVSDRALLVARAIIHDMLRARPELGRVLVAQNQRMALLADDEAITDLPQNRGMKKPAPDDPRLTYCESKLYDQRIGRLSDRDYWNRRERASGGPFLVDAAEDVLGQRPSGWYGETILIHEFAHRLLDALQIADEKDYALVQAAYRHAQTTGLWRREYAGTNVQEYWAEGTQFWFNSNKVAVIDGRRILSHADLKAYDPKLYAALRRVFGRRHHIDADPFYRSPARVPPGVLPVNTAEQC